MRIRLLLRITLITILLFGVAWGAGFAWFLKQVPDQYSQDTIYTDGIIVLTGGSVRLSTAISLLQQGKAQRLLISGVGKGVSLNTLLKQEYVADEISLLENGIDLDYVAQNTHGNAKEAAKWVKSQGYHSIRLVTANYHLPRSMVEFDAALKDTVILPHPVFSPYLNIDQWWRSTNSAMLVLSEYHKYLGSCLRTVIFYFLQDH